MHNNRFIFTNRNSKYKFLNSKCPKFFEKYYSYIIQFK